LLPPLSKAGLIQHNRDERLSRFRCELLVAAARVRQEPQGSLNRTIRKSIAQAIEHWADTVDTIDDKQSAEFDAAAYPLDSLSKGHL